MVHHVKCLAEVKLYQDCAVWRPFLVKTICYIHIEVMKSRYGRMVFPKTMLRWKSGIGKFSLREGKISLSKILNAGQSRLTGLYDLDSLASLPGFRRGIIMECFQISGMIQVSMERL